MIFTFDIPDELIPVIAGKFRERLCPGHPGQWDDDGRTDARLMVEFNVTPERYVKAMHYFDEIYNAIDGRRLVLLDGATCAHCHQKFKGKTPESKICANCFVAGHRGVNCDKYCKV